MRRTTLYALAAMLLAAAAEAFAPDDATFVIGAGTNTATLVIDWRDGATPRAWRYRWDGTATARDLFEAVVAADGRLYRLYHPAYPDTAIFSIGYDADDDGGRYDGGWPGFASETGGPLDPDDLYREGWSTGYWSLWSGSDPYGAGSWLYLGGSGFANAALGNGTWVGWSFDADFSSAFGAIDDRPGLPTAAASPYATELVSYTPGSVSALDWISMEPFTNAHAALGRPTVDTTGDGFYIPVAHPVPVVPVGPAFRSFELVSVGGGGELVLAFDHPVTDDPANPYGIDVIVFGNTLQQIASGGTWTNGNPQQTTVGGTAAAEGGLVAVSQDGSAWFALAGPDADGFAPTLGRRYDPASPDPALGAGNLWWGAPTDPRRPLDPAVAAADFNGATAADMSRAYGRSAGGAGFDIAPLALPADPVTGRKWFRYLRIQQSGFSHPEIDAVADVAPDHGYEGWLIGHFDFWELTNAVLVAETADPDSDGWLNLLEYTAGRMPRTPEADPLFGLGTEDSTNGAYAVVSYGRRAELIDTVVRVHRTQDYAAWSTNNVIQQHGMQASTGGLVRVEAAFPADAPTTAFRLEVRRP